MVFEIEQHKYYHTLTALGLWFPQAARVERAPPPAEGGAEGPAATEQQASAATRAHLPAL